MNLTQLQYFCTLARTEHVTRAADELCITQSTLSKTISALERELGFSLFDHRRGSIRLNKRGQVFLRGVENSLASLDKAVADVQGAAQEEDFILRIATPHPYSYGYLGIALGEFLTDYPGAHLYNEITNGFSDVFGHLSAGRLDCVVAPRKVTTDRAIIWQPICTERLVLVVQEQTMPNRTEASLSEFRDWNFCLSNHGSDQRFVEDDILYQANISPNIVYVGTDMPYVISHLQLPKLVAMIPESGIAGIPPGARLQILNLTDPFCKLTLGIYYKAGTENENLKQFINFIQRRMGTIVRPIW